MLTTILHTFKNTMGVLAFLALLASCHADQEVEPVPVAGPTKTSFSLVDSIKVDTYYKNASPEAYQNYHGKTYEVFAQDKLDAFYFEENGGVTLYFKDTSSDEVSSWLTIHFKNRTLANLPATQALKEAEIVCVQNGQTFKDGTRAMSPGCIEVTDGAISLLYDARTKVLSGSIVKLKLPLDYFVPDYAFPNRNGNLFKASGSSRNLNISFENLKARKG
ncbi:hypothetical protein [Rufibacter sp. LB8]|uniref:hypothetical protein n=1 Tax=Rufibacter sp. LB8 TaxID=2777781 RepID=UPI00178C7CC7|nr:hypothetical protein [Rufibacter sp. LB8]